MNAEKRNRIYIPYEPKEGEILPNGTQFSGKEHAAGWVNCFNGFVATRSNIETCKFRILAPEEDDTQWEEVPVGELLKYGDRFAFNGIGPFEDVAHLWHNTEHSVAVHCVRRRKAVETPKPLAGVELVDEALNAAWEPEPPKPRNIYLPYLLEKADEAINGDQSKAEQLIAAKAEFTARVIEIMR